MAPSKTKMRSSRAASKRFRKDLSTLSLQVKGVTVTSFTQSMLKTGTQMRRREFNYAIAALAMARSAVADDAAGGITAVQGIRVGHFTDSRRPTGCTVLIFDKSATAGVDVRGSAPGTRETDLLSPTNTVQQVQAILLSGGSAYGLAAATGVVKWLEEHNLGVHVGSVTVPIVPAAVIYDLGVGDPKIRPTADSGYQAC